MKKAVLYLLFSFISIQFSQAQNEFKIYSNGLMYDSTTMAQLEFIVDSLNLKFKACSDNVNYKSKSQTQAAYVYLEKKNVKKAKQAIDNGISFEDFKTQFPAAEINEKVLVVRYKYQYNGEEKVEYSEIPTSGGYGNSIEKALLDDQYSNWVYAFSEKSTYSGDYLRAFYFHHEFKKEIIPFPYSRYIQYADCLIDTSSFIFRDGASRRSWHDEDEQSKAIRSFIKYTNEASNFPSYEDNGDEDYYKIYNRKYAIWDSTKYETLDSLALEPKFEKMLSKAYQSAIENSYSTDLFEEYVARYLSKKEALELKRNRIVVGGCSMDNSPRVHAMNIAILSAETVNWEIFLRSHLNIMNDYFQRVSDGSYAYAGRKTYLKELEELDINTLDLLFGITLRFDNQNNNHYYGSIPRIGRALADSKYPKEFENKVFGMLEDDRLDDYNRMLMYYLILNYVHNIDEKKYKKEILDRLGVSILTLPAYLADNIEIKSK